MRWGGAPGAKDPSPAEPSPIKGQGRCSAKQVFLRRGNVALHFSDPTAGIGA